MAIALALPTAPGTARARQAHTTTSNPRPAHRAAPGVDGPTLDAKGGIR